MASVINISAYRFAKLNDLKPLRERLTAVCRERSLKGTILLSTEGINLFVAGPGSAIEELLAILHSVPGLEGLEAKFSESHEQPFRRMLVKIKKEIIAFGVSSIDPVDRPAPRMSAQELKKLLDDRQPVTLIDTRNDFEVHLGTFQNAIPIGVRHFREFPEAVAKLPALDQDHPIVTFCTGGIRCEKAAPYMIEQGYKNIYQLDGGILKYFEECQSAHYHGECFVFDKRVGLAADLHESGHGLCYVCQGLLTPEELKDPRTVEGVSCPQCYRSPEEEHAAELARHRELLRQAVDPLPGKEPQDNFRPLKVHARHAGFTMIDFLCDLFPHIPRQEWMASCAAGDIVDENRHSVTADTIVEPGERWYTRERSQSEPDVNGAIDILYEDDAIIVLNKPAPLPMHPSGRYNRNTLQSILRTVYAPQTPRPAHRLDANTSGVAVFTRKAAYARRLQTQFERGEVEKQYLARVKGIPSDEFFQCHAAIGTTVGHFGARVVDEDQGLPAQTEFERIARFPDGTALLVVTPKTGRTNQIRVHLRHLGFPIVGDAMYGEELGEVQTLSVTDDCLCLHAWRLTFTHPKQGEKVTFEAPPPAWTTAEYRNCQRKTAVE